MMLLLRGLIPQMEVEASPQLQYDVISRRATFPVPRALSCHRASVSSQTWTQARSHLCVDHFMLEYVRSELLCILIRVQWVVQSITALIVGSLCSLGLSTAKIVRLACSPREYWCTLEVTHAANPGGAPAYVGALCLW